MADGGELGVVSAAPCRRGDEGGASGNTGAAGDTPALRAMLDAMPGAIVLLDDSGAVVDCNTGWLALATATGARVVGAHVGDVLPWPSFIANLREATERRERVRFVEARCGRVYEHVLTPTAERFVVACTRDVTDELRAQRGYHALFQKMQYGVALHEIICDELGAPVDYRFLAVNPAFERLTGLTAASVLGRTVLEVMPSTEHHWIERYGRVALHDEVLAFEEFSAALGKHFEVTAYSPAPHQFAAVFADVTDRKRSAIERRQLQEQLHHLQKVDALASLAGGFAHDFNNVIGAIVSLAHLALIDPLEVQESLEGITVAAARARDLVARIQSAGRRAADERQPVQLARVIDDVLQLTRGSLPPTIALTSDVSDCGPVLANRTEVHQVLMNLVTNAFHAMEEAAQTPRSSARPCQLTVALRESVTRGARMAEVRVVDNGCGMDAATLRRIFEVDFTTKAARGGSGLGLPIALGIVKLHGGWIDVESELGVGTTFTVYLPLHEALSGPPPALDLPSVAPGGGVGVVLVDDDPHVLPALTRVLQRFGYRVDAFGEAAPALAELAAHPERHALVLTDLVMPNCSGVEFARAVLEVNPAARVMVLSGLADAALERQAMEVGVARVLKKPIEPLALARAIQDVLAESGAHVVERA